MKENNVCFTNNNNFIEFINDAFNSHLFISTNYKDVLLHDEDKYRYIEVLLSEGFKYELYRILDKVAYRTFVKHIHSKGGSRNTGI